MSAEKGWIGESQPPKEWHRSHASYMAGKFAQAASEQMRKAEAAAVDEWKRRQFEEDPQRPQENS